MADDDKESELAPKPKAPPPSGTSGRWLALIPAVVAAVLFPLMMPRPTVPRDVPLPLIDEASLAREIAADKQLAAAARASRLPTDILAVGSALRGLNVAQAAELPYEQRGQKEASVAEARIALDVAVRTAMPREGAEKDFLALRAVQTDEFLTEVARAEATGQPSKELVEIAGAFLRHMREAGWMEGNRVVLDEAQRRTIYKMMWNGLVGFGNREAFQPTVDEHRALYTLYLTRPHPPEAMREELAFELANAQVPERCKAANENLRRATELWRVEKIKQLGMLDPTYPSSYAQGVGYYRAGRLDNAIDAFRSYAEHTPDGPYVLRARNHLKAALVANAQ